jgi:hypothetical protein
MNARRQNADWQNKMNSARSWTLLVLLVLIFLGGCAKHIERPAQRLPLPAPALLEAAELEAAMVNLEFLLQGPTQATAEELDAATTRAIGACKVDSIRFSGWLDWWATVPPEFK